MYSKKDNMVDTNIPSYFPFKVESKMFPEEEAAVPRHSAQQHPA